MFPGGEEVLGGGLEPPCLAAYAPQTYVSAISPPEQNEERTFYHGPEPPQVFCAKKAGKGRQRPSKAVKCRAGIFISESHAPRAGLYTA